MLHKCSFLFTRFPRQVNISIFILQMKDRKVEQFKQEHFKHLLFLVMSREAQRPYLKDLLCVAVMVSSEAGCALFPHSSSQHRRNESLVQATAQRFNMQSNLSDRLPPSHLPSVPSHMFPSPRTSAGTCPTPSVS